MYNMTLETLKMNQKSEFGLELYFILNKLDRKKIIPLFFNNDKNSKRDFEKFLKIKYFPKLVENELEEAKLEFIKTKIIERQEDYISIFENLLKNKFEEIGLNSLWLEDKNFLLSSEFIDKIFEMPYDIGNIAFVISAYYIYKENDKLDESNNGYLLNKINNVLEVENILDEKLYLRYKKKRIFELCEYLRIETNQLEDFFWTLNEFLFDNNLWKEVNLHRESKKCEYMNLMDIKMKEIDSIILNNFPNLNLDAIRIIVIMLKDFFYENHIENNPLDYKTFSNYLNKALNKTLLLHLYKKIIANDNNYSLSMIVRLPRIEQDEVLVFLNEVFNGIYLNYLYDNLKKEITNNNILSNNIENVDVNVVEDKLKEKDIVIDNLQKEKVQLELTNKSISKQLKDCSDTTKKQTKAMETSYKEEISKLKKQLQELEKENKKLKQDNIELNEIRNALLSLEDEQEDTFSLDKIDLSQFEDKRYIFVGGRFELLKKLEEIFPKGKFYHVKPQNGIDITKTDKIVIFPKNINHPLYWEAIDIAKKNNIPFIFTLGTNLETVMKDIIKNL